MRACFFFFSNPIFIKTLTTCAPLLTAGGCGLQRFLSVQGFLWPASHTDVLGGGRHARHVSQRYCLLSRRKSLCLPLMEPGDTVATVSNAPVNLADQQQPWLQQILKPNSRSGVSHLLPVSVFAQWQINTDCVYMQSRIELCSKCGFLI